MMERKLAVSKQWQRKEQSNVLQLAGSKLRSAGNTVNINSYTW